MKAYELSSTNKLHSYGSDTIIHVLIMPHETREDTITIIVLGFPDGRNVQF